MKKVIFFSIVAAVFLLACNNKSGKPDNDHKIRKDSVIDFPKDTSNLASAVDSMIAVSPVKNIVTFYLNVKNALAGDNTKEAAVAGSNLKSAIEVFDESILNAAQQKTFRDIRDDAMENAEHIGESSGNIAHQREHFEFLSREIYDLVKVTGGGEVLYKVFCPMADKGKGAYWISETKEIKNPYFGKEMSTCGIIKEELK